MIHIAAIAAFVSIASAGPVARTVDVDEDVFGVHVKDPYRWMEGNDNAETTQWLQAQGDVTRAFLDKLPVRSKLYDRVRELGMSTGGASSMQIAGGRMFFERTAPGAQLPKLTVQMASGM